MSIQDKVRLGFIGAGWWATSNHIPVFAARDDVELVAVCRLGQARARAGAGSFRIRVCHPRLPRVIGPCSDSTGSSWPRRTPCTTNTPGAALEAGLHEMCENP